MNKKITIIATFLLVLILSSLIVNADINSNDNVPTEVIQVAKDNFDKIVNRISADLAKEYNTQIVNSDFTLGTGYNISHINNDIDINKNYENLKDITVNSKEWLFVIKYKEKSVSYIKVGYIDNSYKVLMYGGNADMFDVSLDNFAKLNSKEMILLSYMGDYYMLSEDNKILEVASNKSAYILNKDKYDNPMSGSICLEIIKENINKRNRNKETVYSSSSLIDYYYSK
ncbi:hypothetical protein PV797_02035 [Clostridiaceae bacterium M8S5]|nr:hypothetical protein PV797_02035 [Clostridiaceae bacterium M8S5]